MEVQFILGTGGSGKTSHCIGSIVDLLQKGCTDSMILLVPEQATYESERSILTAGDISGFSNVRVLSFDRLRFFLSTGISDGSQLSRLGQEMIVHKILRDSQQSLKVFGQTSRKPGMAAQIAKTITELHEYAKKPADIDEFIESLTQKDPNSQTILKFQDIR